MTSPKDTLVALNRAQEHSEIDPFTERRYEQFAGQLGREVGRVLDVGCNTGRGGAVLKQLRPDFEIVGLDCVPERLAALSGDVYHDVVCAFANEIPLGDATVDAIVGGEFIEHVSPEQIDKSLCEFFRILKLKGRLMLTTPNPYYLKNKLRHLSVLTEPSHRTQHFPECLKWRMRTVGFSNVRILGSGKMSNYLGMHFPIRSVYGSYLISGDKW